MNLPKRIDSILRKLRNELEDSFQADKHFAEAHQQITELLQAVCLEVIGKNEKNPGIRKDIFIETYQGRRNALRATQRQKLNSLLENK